MTGQIVIRSSSPVNLTRRQPLLAGTLTPSKKPTPSRTKPSPNVGEVAGGTAAECFVVCCCCPCLLVEFLILAVYKVPASICRRLWRKKMIKKKKKKGLLHLDVYCDELSDVDFTEFETVKVSIDGSDEAVELDKKMWDQFHSTGFWRSASRRHS